MGKHIEKAIKAKRVPWVKVTSSPCSACGLRSGHAPWWKSTPPPSCEERARRAA